MKRKISAVILCSIMAISLALTGCGGSGSSSAKSEVKEETKKEEPKEEAKEETKEEAAPEATGEVYTIKFSNVGAAGGFMDTAFARVGERLNEVAVEKLGYEAFNIELYSGGMLASSDQEDWELVTQGTVQCSYAPNAIMYQYLPHMPILNVIDLPYIFSSKDAFYDFANNSDIMQDVYAQLEEQNGVIFGCAFQIGDLYIASTKKPIHTLEDLAGQKIRIMTSDTYVATAEALGFAPTPMAFGEVYTGLQQGTIDGVMASTLSFTDQKFYQEAPYIVRNGSGLLNPEFLFWNKAWIESLPDDVKAVVLQVLEEDQARIWRDTSDEFLEDADQIMVDYGCELYDLPDADYEIWKEKCLSTYDGLADICGGKDNITAVQTWLAENGY